MTTRSAASVLGDRVEPLLEEFLAEVVTGIRPVPRRSEAQSVTTVWTQAAMVSFSRAVTQAAPVGRALFAEALSPALADALAPALAKELAPGIVTTLSRLAGAAQWPGGEPAAIYRQSETAREDSRPGRSMSRPGVVCRALAARFGPARSAARRWGAPE